MATQTDSASRRRQMQLIGLRIVQARARRGMTQSDLAAEIGRSRRAIGRWESGDRMCSIIDCIAIAEGLSCPIGELVSGIGGVPPASAHPSTAGDRRRR